MKSTSAITPNLYQELVSELSLARPNQQKLKKLTATLNLPWNGDPIELMSTVLQSMDRFTMSPAGRKSRTYEESL